MTDDSQGPEGAEYDIPYARHEDLAGFGFEERAPALLAMTSQCAKAFFDAEAAGNTKVAHKAAAAALNNLGGLFDDREDPGYMLVAHLIRTLFDLRRGMADTIEGRERDPNILLRPCPPITGMSKGTLHTMILTMAVAMRAIGCERALYKSAREAETRIAKMLTDLRLSFRNTKDHEPAGITRSAILAWADAERYPAVARQVEWVRQGYERDLDLMGVHTRMAFEAYFRKQAAPLVADWRNSQP